MASQVGEAEALRLHATELLLMLGTVIVMLFDQSRAAADDGGRGAAEIYPFRRPSSAIMAEASFTA